MKNLSSVLTSILLITFTTFAFSEESKNIFNINTETLTTIDENFSIEIPEPTTSEEMDFTRNKMNAPIKWEIIPREKSPNKFYIKRAMAPQTKEEFCENMKEPNYFKQLILDQRNRLSFRNAGGFFNGGVCWWHSFLEQRQTYLTVFKPELPKPTKKQVLKIFSKYFWRNSVVEIPGYDNFYDFSLAWHKVLQKKLNDWQAVDGILGASWINGLAGKSRVSPKQLKSKMDALYKEINENNRIVWQKLQFPGVAAHAWLVVNMDKTSSGYKFTVIDSNYKNEYIVYYRNGDVATRVNGYPYFVGYTQHLGDFKKIAKAQKKYCK